MYSLLFGVVFLAACVFGYARSSCPASIPNTEPSSYQAFKTSCYYFSKPAEATNVIQAQQRCKSGGGHLAYIHTREENQFLRYHLSHTYGLTHNDCWIGLKFDPGFGLLWDDASAVSFNNIPQNNRSALKDHTFCITFSGNSGSWKINDCLKKFMRPVVSLPRLPFVCEFELK